MTCKFEILGLDGSATQARALLDSASSMSFISERLTQQLHLKQKRLNVSVTGIGGNSFPLLPRGMVDFRVTSLGGRGRRLPMQAIVLHKVTSNLPSSPTPFNDSWKCLIGLELVDPDFRSPGTIDLLLGKEVFGQIVLRGQRFGPRGSPMALKTHFGWVLSGAVDSKQQQGAQNCCLATTSTDDLLRRFWKVEKKPKKQAVRDPNTPNKQQRLVHTVKDVSQAINQVVNCLPGLTDIDLAIKSISQASSPLQGGKFPHAAGQS